MHVYEKQNKKYLHKQILQEGIALEVRENGSLWDLKYGRLIEKKILKLSFQNFFNIKGKMGAE